MVAHPHRFLNQYSLRAVGHYEVASFHFLKGYRPIIALGKIISWGKLGGEIISLGLS